MLASCFILRYDTLAFKHDFTWTCTPFVEAAGEEGRKQFSSSQSSQQCPAVSNIHLPQEENRKKVSCKQFACKYLPYHIYICFCDPIKKSAPDKIRVPHTFTRHLRKEHVFDMLCKNPTKLIRKLEICFCPVSFETALLAEPNFHYIKLHVYHNHHTGVASDRSKTEKKRSGPVHQAENSHDALVQVKTSPIIGEPTPVHACQRKKSVAIHGIMKMRYCHGSNVTHFTYSPACCSHTGNQARLLCIRCLAHTLWHALLEREQSVPQCSLDEHD